ncbi:ATPase, T2SS/T4P/T4SS family [Geobacter pickeringii]|uniref:Pilus assembly protein PilB n=1 Tax=Geobacter pickeringii TaxID=345632 RepID=A0A0B5BHD4_9BACT|nr:ATPase, T2SS/T4P/T4SS family [Geobacter pickeringii]AJE04594.1 pilus assembly protein PilB [Geobacter pickeringii]
MESIVKEGSLGSILFKCQIISEDDIRAALEEQVQTGSRFGEALVRLGIVTQEDIDWALSNQLNIPYVRLKPTMVDRGAVAFVPAALARQYNLMPLICAGGELSIAIADPLNNAAIAAVEKATGCTVSISVGLIREIREMQELFYGPSEVAESLGFTSANFPSAALEAINRDLGGAKLVDYLLLFIVQQKLSSLSLQPVGDAVIIAARRGGQTREVGRLAPTHYPEVILRVRKLARIVGAGEFAVRGELSFAWKGKTIAFQVALLRGEGGDHLTLRMHIATQFPATVADLGLSAEKMATFETLAAAERGMVLVGVREPDLRSRMIDLYLQEHETAAKTVIVLGGGAGQGEKRFPRVPLSPDTDLGEVVTAVLEHDPDIIVLEDATDERSFSALCKAAIRGKLVVAGMAFGDTAPLLKQLLYFRDRHYLAPGQLRGVIVAKGIRTLCPDCRRSEPCTPEEARMLRLGEGGSCCRAAGCPACDQTGHGEKRYLVDLLTIDEGARGHLEGAATADEFLDYAKTRGWRGLAEEGRELLTAGDLSPEEFAASILT